MTLIKTIAAAPGQECQHIEMTAEEESAFVADQQRNQSESEIADLKSQAQKALNKSDMVAIRCLKAGILFPSEWKSYVINLRSIINSGTGEIPQMPDYPEGT